MEEIRAVLDPRVIKLNLNAIDKKDAITQLAQGLKAADYIDDVAAFIKDIYVRESEGITGIGQGVAIPHGKSDDVQNVGVAIGILNHGIEWETLDDQLVNIVILFAVSNDQEASRNQLKLLSLFAGRLGSDHVIEALHEATTVEEVIETFTKEKRVS
ncbi:MAG: fructose PTS transporter subunit IIA [Lactobacillus sp.]|jgi:PTS system fructose-specific IIA component|nr:fructose PTS transporter subunit IIA [Lactobacillus sp.]